MDNSNQLFDQIKKAVEKNEAQTFSNAEKVWQNVASKLDQEQLQTDKKMWQKWAVAASFLLLITIGYQSFIVDNTTTISPTNDVVLKDSLPFETQDTTQEPSFLKTEEAVVLQMPKRNPLIQADAVPEVDMQPDETTLAMAAPDAEIAEESNILSKSTNQKLKVNPMFLNGIEAKVVDGAVSAQDKKTPPLVVMDGYLQSDSLETAAAVKAFAASKSIDLEDITILNNPLYIIDGHYYDEESLFGTHPTSPYYPLKKQLIESILILQDEKAMANYGEMGKNGVVIIKTKYGKPVHH
ncbi:hypothetical protein FLBR109950_12810 [Flavobacterium branchiophilum]|uniref:TonB-dependent receptor plug domain-containing protein n=1 Tax=Flavobacterium branchiophilum (strain FL-15) TaxID=1034807 RepID=G2Z5A8_FLABF|nr:anti ECF-type sigma factor [Flavobacterium branchiophilum]CCB68614.1 Probable transmembrane protein of unknown function; putative anti ECF-type sigma factor [Flavobacterium branchiophilum FL-15]